MMKYYPPSLILGKFRTSPNKPKRVASIAVVSGNKLLMGQRRDNGRWTLPGGGMNLNETTKEAAFRELKEESGIQPKELYYLGSENVKSPLDKDILVHAFVCFGTYNTDTSHDPDAEVKKWQWVDITNGIPKEIAENLHSPKNVTLKLIGLQDW